MASRSMFTEHLSSTHHSLVQHFWSARHRARLWTCTPTQDYILLLHGPDQVSSLLETPSRNLQKTGHAVCPASKGGEGFQVRRIDGSLGGEEKASGRKRSLSVP